MERGFACACKMKFSVRAIAKSSRAIAKSSRAIAKNIKTECIFVATIITKAILTV